MKDENTVAARLAGRVMALDAASAAPLLLAQWPSADNGHQDFAPARGERYTVQRGVAVMPLCGILTPDMQILERVFGWATYRGVEQTCAELAANEDVAAIVLDVNSPGGMILGLEGAAAAIANLSALKPVYVLVNPLAASAAYWLASQGAQIVMTPGSEAGSIGVMRMSAWPVQPGSSGTQFGIHVSSHARAKYPDPTSETGLAEIQRGLDEAEAQFLTAVARGRGIDPQALPGRLSVTADEADGGAMFRADAAVSRGLADSIEARQDFYDRIFAQHGPSRPAAAPRGAGRGLKVRAQLAQARAAL